MEWTAPYDLERNAKEVEKCYQTGFVRQLEIDYVHPNGRIFPVEINATCLDTEDGRRVVSLCRDVSKRRQAQEALQREHRTLKLLLQSSDHERQLIAYEIHDGLAQQLAGGIMQMDTYDYQKEREPKLAADAFQAGIAMLRECHAEARRLISDVRPFILDDQGVGAAVTHLVNEERYQKSLQIEYDSDLEFERLNPTLENAIYRIVQEGLTNACRHSMS